MRELDLVEQEHLGQFKNFWKTWSSTILIAAITFMVVFAGYRFWQSYKSESVAEASVLYELTEEKLRTQDLEAAATAVERLRKDHQHVQFTSMAVMLMAKATYEADRNNAQNVAKAQDYFSWVVSYGSEAWIRDFARVQKMHLFIGHQQLEKALAIGQLRETTTSAPAILELMGDALFAMNKRSEALENYQQALEENHQLQQRFESNTPRTENPLLRMKINALRQ